GRELAAWRASLVTDLGGDPSTAQLALVDMAVRSKLLVDSVDAYLLAMPSPVDKRHRRLWPVVRERQALVNQLQAILPDLGVLRDLGRERKRAPVETLESCLARKAEEEDADAAEAGEADHPA